MAWTPFFGGLRCNLTTVSSLQCHSLDDLLNPPSTAHEGLRKNSRRIVRGVLHQQPRAPLLLLHGLLRRLGAVVLRVPHGRIVIRDSVVLDACLPLLQLAQLMLHSAAG